MHLYRNCNRAVTREHQIANRDVNDPLFRFKISEFEGANQFAKILNGCPQNITNASFERMGIPKFANLNADFSVINGSPDIENIFGWSEEPGRNLNKKSSKLARIIYSALKNLIFSHLL